MRGWAVAMSWHTRTPQREAWAHDGQLHCLDDGHNLKEHCTPAAGYQCVLKRRWHFCRRAVWTLADASRPCGMQQAKRVRRVSWTLLGTRSTEGTSFHAAGAHCRGGPYDDNVLFHIDHVADLDDGSERETREQCRLWARKST